MSALAYHIPSPAVVLPEAQAVLQFIPDGSDLVCSMAAGEPVELLDAVEQAASEQACDGLTVHQMHAIGPRRSMTGELKSRMRHISYFISAPDRPHLGHGVEFIPTNFSQVPSVIRSRARNPIVLASVAERDGKLYWGTCAEYCAALVRDGAPLIAELNAQMPHLPACPIDPEQVLAVYRTNRPLHELTTRIPSQADEQIADFVAERIPSGSTLQIGVGAIPDMVCTKLQDRSGLRIHSELFSDGMARLITAGATCVSPLHPAVATFALGTQSLYQFMDGNRSVQLAPVDVVNRPTLIASQPRMVSVCATTEVDLCGQCASATVAGHWYSGAGGQQDFMRGVRLAPDGQSFVVLRSTLKDGSSRINATLAPGSVVITGVESVDMVVTEHGVAELKGATLSERARALIAIAAPEHRDELRFGARKANLL